MTTKHYGKKQYVRVIWDDGNEEGFTEQPVVLAYYPGEEIIELRQLGGKVDVPARMVPELIRVLREMVKEAEK